MALAYPCAAPCSWTMVLESIGRVLVAAGAAGCLLLACLPGWAPAYAYDGALLPLAASGILVAAGRGRTLTKLTTAVSCLWLLWLPSGVRPSGDVGLEISIVGMLFWLGIFALVMHRNASSLGWLLAGDVCFLTFLKWRWELWGTSVFDGVAATGLTIAAASGIAILLGAFLSALAQVNPVVRGWDRHC